MNSKIFKIAAGIIIVGIVAIALKVFTGTNTVTNVALVMFYSKFMEKVILSICHLLAKVKIRVQNKCMMLQPGIVRIDTPEIWGGINFNFKF